MRVRVVMETGQMERWKDQQQMHEHRESEDVGWGGESRGESMDYQESLTSISAATTNYQQDQQTERQTGRHADRQADRQTDRQADRQADRHTGRETDRQTDRHTHFVPSLFDSNLNQSLSASLLLFTYCKQRAHIIGMKQI